MRGFTAPRSKQITFTRDNESLTLTVHALPPLFRMRLRMQWPGPDDSAPDVVRHNHIMRRGVIIAAEGLRRTEDGIPTLPVSDDAAEWRTASDALLDMFAAAGLNDAEVQYIASAVIDLSEAVGMAGLDAEGND